MSPQTCKNCGMLFMNPHVGIDTPRLCNNCTKPGEKNMSELEIKIKIPHKVASIIEEKCINQGISISDYFLSLINFGPGPQDEFEDSKGNKAYVEKRYDGEINEEDEIEEEEEEEKAYVPPKRGRKPSKGGKK